ncbi:MAG TPA: alpha/beta fold hydrolase [Rhabdaerophilum sp.]|nr:alpha/beta fold hydrolase [Rhabdaerophilum sp.]
MRPRIVFLPGLLCDATVFSHQIASLGANADIAVADFSQASSIEEMARIALACFAGPVTLVGFSMGGRAALKAIEIAPERVARLCLMDTGAAPARENEAETRQVMIDYANRNGMTALAGYWLPPMLHKAREKDAALLAPLTAMVERATPALHERQIRALLNRPDARTVLSQIACPTLVMAGRQDRWSPLAQHEELAATIPGATLAVIENAGHFACFERPEAVTAVLRSWLGFDRKEAA